jgi:hypothetical protein
MRPLGGHDPISTLAAMRTAAAEWATGRGRRIAALAIALPLVVSAGCGSSDDGITIPKQNADTMLSTLDQIKGSVESGACDQAVSAADALRRQINGLPKEVGKDAKDALREGAINLQTLASDQCSQPKQPPAPPSGATGASGAVPPESDETQAASEPAPPPSDKTRTQAKDTPERPGNSPNGPPGPVGNQGGRGHGDSGGHGHGTVEETGGAEESGGGSGSGGTGTGGTGTGTAGKGGG